MAYYPKYGVRLDRNQVPLICVNSCFEVDDILHMELSTTDGMPSITIQAESCVKGVPAAEWVLMDVRPEFIVDVESNGLIIYDLTTTASFFFREVEAGVVVESSINTNKVLLPAAMA